MKFNNLEDMSTKITDSECLKERWPSLKILEVFFGSQHMVAQHKRLFPKMTKIMNLKPLLYLGCKRREGLIIHSSNVTMQIQDMIKNFKFEKFPIIMKTQCHSSDCSRHWRNRKRKRQSINLSEPTALWCYSMIIYIRGAVVSANGKTVIIPTFCGAPPNSHVL